MTDKYAIIVAVSSYEDEIAKLPYTNNDAIRLYKILTGIAEFSTDRVYLLAERTEQKTEEPICKPPTRSNILQAIRYVADTASEDSLILLYVAGHGAEISKAPYLLTSDTKLSVLQDTAIDIHHLNKILESSKARCIVRVFDACRSHATAGRAFTGRMSDGLQEAIMFQATGWATISSCSSGEVAYESPEFEQGVFSYHFCEALEGKAALDDGMVTLERLVDYVKLGVRTWCDRQTLQQTPHLLSDLSGTLVLSKTKVLQATRLTSIENPLTLLHVGLDNHLSQLPRDVRNMTFTDSEQLSKFSNLILKSITSIADDFSHQALSINLSEPKSLRAFGGGLEAGAFEQEVSSLSLKEELKGSIAIKCSFSSSEAVIPTTDLFIVATRFSFFYWIWWCHVCHTDHLENRFKPDPNYKKGFFTFKPEAVLNEEKVKRALDQILEQTSTSIMEWSKQLSQFIDTRIAPLRKLGDIIGE